MPKSPPERDGMVQMMTYIEITYDQWFNIKSDGADKPLIDEAITLTSYIIGKLPGELSID